MSVKNNLSMSENFQFWIKTIISQGSNSFNGETTQPVKIIIPYDSSTPGWLDKIKILIYTIQTILSLYFSFLKDKTLKTTWYRACKLLTPNWWSLLLGNPPLYEYSWNHWTDCFEYGFLHIQLTKVSATFSKVSSAFLGSTLKMEILFLLAWWSSSFSCTSFRQLYSLFLVNV